MTLVGTVVSQGVVGWAAAERRHMYRTVVDVNDHRIPILAIGDDARGLGAALTNSLVRIKGELIEERWRTQEGKLRSHLTVRARKTEVLRCGKRQKT